MKKQKFFFVLNDDGWLLPLPFQPLKENFPTGCKCYLVKHISPILSIGKWYADNFTSDDFKEVW